MSKNRPKAASQWFQAIISLTVLSCIYMSRGYFWEETTASYAPDTPPIQVQQREYWNGDMTGFASGRAEISDQTDIIMARQGVIYDKDGIRISLFQDMDSDQIEKSIQSNLPRFYTRIDAGTLLVEWNISSSRVSDILTKIQSS